MSIQLYENQNLETKIFPPVLYTHDKLQALNFGGVLKIGQSTGKINWEISADALEALRKYRFNFRLDAVRDANGNLVAPTSAYIIPTHYFPFISSVKLYTPGNVNLCEVLDVDKYNKIAGIYNLDFRKREHIDGFLFENENGLRLRGTAVANVANIIYLDRYSLDYENLNTDYSNIGEPQNFIYSLNTGSFNRYFSVSFRSLLPDSIWNTVQDLPHKSILKLEITFNTLNQIIRDVPDTTVVPMVPALLPATSFLWLDNISISRYYRTGYSATDFFNSLPNKTIKMLMPLTQTYITPKQVSQNTNQEFQMKITNTTQNNESRIYKSYVSVFSDDNATRLLACDNLDGARWINIKIKQDSKDLGEYDWVNAFAISKENASEKNSVFTHQYYNHTSGGLYLKFAGDKKDSGETMYNNEFEGYFFPTNSTESIIGLSYRMGAGAMVNNLQNTFFGANVILSPLYIVDGMLFTSLPQQ